MLSHSGFFFNVLFFKLEDNSFFVCSHCVFNLQFPDDWWYWLPLKFVCVCDYLFIRLLAIHMGFPGGSVVKNPPTNAEVNSVPGWGRYCGKGNGNQLQYYFFFNFELGDNCFTLLCWFLPYINIISHRYIYVPSLLHCLTLGCHRAPDLSSLHTANFHWLSTLHTVIYMLPCYSLNSSHPLLLPLCPQVCSLHLGSPSLPCK